MRLSPPFGGHRRSWLIFFNVTTNRPGFHCTLLANKEQAIRDEDCRTIKKEEPVKVPLFYSLSLHTTRVDESSRVVFSLFQSRQPQVFKQSMVGFVRFFLFRGSVGTSFLVIIVFLGTCIIPITCTFLLGLSGHL